MKTQHIIIISLVCLNFTLAIVLYSHMPEQMASHWNIRGEADGYMSRPWGLFFIPAITLAMMLFLYALPKMDPMNNFRKFNAQYEQILLVLAFFMTYIYALTLVWNTGIKISFNRALAPAFGILFYVIGVAIGKAKQNWFVGIRTPWTLSSAKVWDKTHKLGSELFRISGFICLFGAFFENAGFYLIIIPIILSSVFLACYSYFEWRKLNIGKNRKISSR